MPNLCRINNLKAVAGSINLHALDSAEIVRRAPARIGSDRCFIVQKKAGYSIYLLVNNKIIR